MQCCKGLYIFTSTCNIAQEKACMPYFYHFLSMAPDVQAPMIGSWSDKYGRKPFLIIAFSTASLPLLVILLHLQFGVSMLFYFPAQVRSGYDASHCMSSVACSKLLQSHVANYSNGNDTTNITLTMITQRHKANCCSCM